MGILASLRASGIQTGLSVEGCLTEARSGFQNLRSLISNPVTNADYLLCNIEQAVEATNVNNQDTGKYLDTTLYIRKYFQMLFPEESSNISIIFRLNTKPATLDKTAHVSSFHKSTFEFLTFISDVYQYSRAYQMNLIVPAFDDFANGTAGWWTISNFENLANASVFIEKEAEFLEQETWRPTTDTKVTMIWAFWTPLVICGIGLIFTVLVVLAASRCWHGRRNFIILTREEVEQFRKGDNDGAMAKDTTECNRNFPEEFEVPWSKFTLINIIGSGQFGLVYNATISTGADNGQLTVAVKKPHSDCSRDAFKSLLMELKVLSYIGRHKHVLEFVGAYTEEIGKGITYIATELCENGALQEYLRKLRSNLTEENEKLRAPTTATLHELHRFAHEIALGMEYISGRRVTHGDLSTRNVLLDSNLVCKIGDFGHSRKLYHYEACVRRDEPEGTLKVPWRWLAIESLQMFESTSKSDVWSYGVTLWEIFTLGCVPYPDMSFSNEFIKSLESGLRPSIPNFASEGIYCEMRRCWDIRPELRPNFSELAQFFRIKRDMDYAQIISA